jgi:hypothetical protein
MKMDAWRPKHVEDYDTIKLLWKWKSINLVMLLLIISTSVYNYEVYNDTPIDVECVGTGL